VTVRNGRPSAPNRERLRNTVAARRDAWRELALAKQLSRRAVRRARVESLVLLPLLAGVLVVYIYRIELFGREWNTTVRALTAVALIALGWQFARDVGRALGPTLFRRLEPHTAGTLSFIIRLVALVVAITIALRVLNLSPSTLAVGGALTVVIVGLAAQQTLGNLFAGTVILSARTFRVGERVRLQGGGLAGSVEGLVSSLGLLHTTFMCGADPIMVPNSVVLGVAVSPLREPAGVDMRARLRPGITPVEVQELLEGGLDVPMRGPARIFVEELDADEIIVRITATPERAADGPQLATEVLRAIGPYAASPGTAARELSSFKEELDAARRRQGDRDAGRTDEEGS
jgi:small-conductance mechanosensitive channel